MAWLQYRTDSLLHSTLCAHPTNNGARTRSTSSSRPTGGPPPPPSVATAGNSWSVLRQEARQQFLACLCHAQSAPSSTPTSGGRRVRGQTTLTPQQQQQQQAQHQLVQQPHQAQQQRAEPQQRPICVAADSSVSGVAKAVLFQLQHFGKAEVWATSAANHFTAVTALAEAHQQLRQRHQQGLAATASLSTSDQAIADDQKKGLKKLTLTVTTTDPVEQQFWDCSPTDAAAAASNSTGRSSTNRTKAVADVMQLLLQQLSAEAGAAAVVECRGEQAVTRALKAALSLQASEGLDMVLQPWPGQVVDVVAEKRGEQGRLVNGLLLRMSWAQQQQQEQ